MTSAIGAVVIGRNEGDRLARCLRSISAPGRAVVYVDSGSSDGSPALAVGLGVDVVELDADRPFSAARARNEGLAQLVTNRPGLEYVQFVDGDCEIDTGWPAVALRTLQENPDAAVVCGRVRERHRDASVFNRLCDIEFNRPSGDTPACGGVFAARIRPLQEVGGFNPQVVAGEEPELCRRLRERGSRIVRVDAIMALHDSAMYSMRPWWARAVRSGHAYAQAAALPGGAGVRESLGIWLWACVLPLLALAAVIPTGGWSVLALVAYPLQFVRVALGRKVPGDKRGDRWLYAGACMLAKWPQLLGQVLFIVNRLRRTAPQVLEHRTPSASHQSTRREGTQVP